jgi:hypothetical protein
MHGERMPQPEEHDHVVRTVGSFQILEQSWRPGAVQPNPLELFVARVRRCLQPLREGVEADVIGYLADPEAAHQHTPDAIRSF